MLIEFVGAPGSGKSTLSLALVKRLRILGKNAYLSDEAISIFLARSDLRKIISPFLSAGNQKVALSKYFSFIGSWYLLKFKIKHYTFWRIIDQSFQGRRINQEHLQMIRGYFNRTMIYFQFIEEYQLSDEITLFDEGFAHRITHFISELESPDENEILKYLSFMPKSDLLVYLSAPLEICVERVQSRGLRGRLKNKNSQEVSQFIENSICALNIGVDFMSTQGISIIEINNTDDLETTASLLEIRLSEISEDI
jgi:thymidylate kinase